jgi:uncharacterized membrane protein
VIDTLVFLLLLTAAIGAGLIGGLFFAFSTFIMNAFDRLPAPQAIAAMQAINVSVLNPAFFIAFFGTAVVAIGLAAFAAWNGGVPARTLIFIGAAAYLFGSILVTIVFNVPLNNRLADLQYQAEDMSNAWRAYRVPWTRWNHVRTVASLLAAAAFGAALAF